ncbi:MAG: hypothetical protein QW500_00645 [Candidatus Micrarchaeia archaeon]
MYKQANGPKMHFRRSSDVCSCKQQDERLEFKKFFSDEKMISGLVSEDRITVLTSCSSLLKQIKLEHQLSSCERALFCEIDKILFEEQALSSRDFIGSSNANGGELTKESKLILLNFIADFSKKRDILRETAANSLDNEIASAAVWGLYRMNDIEGLYFISENAVLDITKKYAQIAIYKFEQKNKRHA